jgi:AraC-like DNA-binding protein
MKIEFTIISFIYLALIITSLSVAVVLWNFPRDKNIYNKFLAISIGSILWGLVCGFLIETHLILEVPHIYRTGHVASLVFMPMTYFHARFILTKPGFRFSDIIHGLPVLFYFVDYLPYFIMGTHEKYAIVLHDLSTPFEHNSYDEGWLIPRGFHTASRYVLMVVYLVLHIRLHYLQSFAKNQTHLKRNKLVANWLCLLTGVLVFGFLPLVLNNGQKEFRWLLILFSIALPVVFTTLWLLFHPEILYGLTIKNAPDTSHTNGRATNESLLTSRINGLLSNNAEHPQSEQDKELLLALNKLMLENKKFLEHKYSINNLAIDLNTSPHQLSHFLNSHLQVSFSDFLNKYRIEHCVARIKKGDAQRFTLEALAFESGFNNRNSFRDAFKRFTGTTPSEFMRSGKF